MERVVREAAADGVAAIAFPELSLTGYTCGDLFFRDDLLGSARAALDDFAARTADLPCVSVVGLPVADGPAVYNAAAVVHGGSVVGTVRKRVLPTYAEYYERRQFVPAPHDELPQVFDVGQFRFGVEICEDLWASIPPSSLMACRGVDVVFNISASTDFLGKSRHRRDMARQQSARLGCAYAMACAGVGESSADAVFGGGSLIAANGSTLAEMALFGEGSRTIAADVDIEALRYRRRSDTSLAERPVDLAPVLVPVEAKLPNASPKAISATPFQDEYGEAGWHRKILSIQAAALGRRMECSRVQKLVVGVSGGSDSALALLGAAAALDRMGLPRSNLVAVVMPGFGSTGHTQDVAAKLSRAVGATLRVVDICEACRRHLSDIGHPEDVHDIAYENVQARERTQVLMDIANMEGALVVGTGDLSEIALGWNTYNGDHMSMYQLNASIPKTMVLNPRSCSDRCSRALPPHLLRRNCFPAPPQTTRRRGWGRTSFTTSFSSTTSPTAHPRTSFSRSPASRFATCTPTRPLSGRTRPSCIVSAPRSTSATASRTARRSRSRSRPAPTGACRATCPDARRMG